MLGVKTYRVRKGECFYFKASKKHYLSEQAEDEGVGPVGIFAS